MNSQLYAKTTSSAASAEAVEAIENAFHQQARKMADLMSASRRQKAIENNEMAAAVKDFVTLLPGRYKNCG